MSLSVFVRNDDVRGELDKSLVYLTERLLSNGVLLIHAVEPKNMSKEVIGWLIAMKKAYPERLGIIQHGFEHKIKTALPLQGEFGGGRPFEQQRAEIHQGKLLMDNYFGKLWNQVFSFPYGTYDNNTLHALALEGYNGISTGIRFTRKRRMFNMVGRFIGVKHLMGQNVVYFNEQVPGLPLREYPVVLNNTKKYILPDSGVQKNFLELMNEWHYLPQSIRCRGILVHHRYNSLQDIDELTEFLIYLRSRNIKFLTLSELFNDQVDNS